MGVICMYKIISAFFSSDISLSIFWKDLISYKLRYLKNDITSAISVALLAIPQSMAYSLLAGLPPRAGLFSAIFGTIFTAAFASSKKLVSGPSTGVSILIQTTIAEILHLYYPQVQGAAREALTMNILMHIVLVMGVFQLLASIFNLGKLLQFVSRPVILGYFGGVLIAICVSQAYYFSGITPSSEGGPVIERGIYFVTHIHEIKPITALIGFIATVVLIILRKYIRKWPNALFILVFTSIIVYFLNTYTSFYVESLKDLGIAQTPSITFNFPLISFGLFSKILTPAIAISLLSILEVFSVSRGLAAKGGARINSNQEIFSVGIANTFLSFVNGAMPASGSLSRSLVNFRNKGKTRFSAILSGVFVGVIIFFLWPLVKHIPLASLAAILFVMVTGLIDIEELKICFKATKGDGVVFVITVLSCIIFNLDVAFFIGIVISIMTYLKRAAVPYLVEYTFNTSGRLQILSPKAKKVYRKIRIIGIGGDLFFGAVDLFETALQAVANDPHVRTIVLRLNGVYHMDASMCFAILRLYEYLAVTKRHLVISGLTTEVWQILYKATIVDKIGQDNLFLTEESNPQLSTWRACLRAQDLK